ncbi:MAG: MerR family transcriptional regulator, partial [Paludibacteraceae bacterium]|nr:MerR family transcriptional regulator [Paludibacteraceae bacterium]MBQ2607725.1 MerR family transcriptional regulator [Paludibacteraceae bacterium]
MSESKIYYSIKEASEITGLPFSTLRYWEEQFEELDPRKDGHGNRYYTAEDIEFLKRVRYIRDELKITRIEAIRRELRNDTRQVDVKLRASEMLQRIRQELMDIRSYI